MRRTLLLAVTALVILAGIAVAPPAQAVTAGEAESQFVAKINAVRSAKGLGRLAIDGNLVAIGRRWSGVMASRNQIGHNANFPNEVTSNWVKLGENVGRGGDVDSLFDAFMASPTHYRNIVEPAFTHVGVGVVIAANGVLYTAHQFMRLEPAKPAAPRPAPSPRPPARATTRAPAPAAADTDASPSAPAAGPAPAVVEPSARLVIVFDLLRHLDAEVGATLPPT